MSQETSQWLNTNTLIGYTEKRGNAWHYRASEQGAEPNHYSGAIPVDDVLRRLFNWKPVEGTVETTIMTDDGVTRIVDETRKTIVRPDTQSVLGIFKSGFRIHDYEQWLLRQCEQLLDADLQIGSAGLLRGGAVAWVQVEMSDTIETPEGVSFRPFLTAATSLDGSLASTYQTGSQVVVCDNTLSAALSDKSSMVKIRHSKHSMGKLNDVRDALGIVHSVADTFAAEVAALCSTTVSEQQWEAFTAALTDPGPAPTARKLTNAQTLVDELDRLWKHDERVAPWAGTAYGVVAAVNTHAHHVQRITKGTARAERNMLRAVTGEYDKLDNSTVQLLDRVLQSA